LINFTDIYGYVILCDLSQSAKTTVSELGDRLKTLEDAEAQRQQVSLDWEIRNRVAQGVFIV
jgi:hypothetical protein